jgi:N-acetylneuraminic acid mutarotase
MKYFILIQMFAFMLFSQEWEEVEGLPTNALERNHPVNFTLNGFGYAMTGFNGGGFLLDDVYRYNPETDSWSSRGTHPGGPRGFAYGVAVDGKGYIGFGINQTEYLKDLWEFNPETAEWTELSECPCEGRRHPAMVGAEGKVYVGFGDNNVSGNLKDFWRYDIENDAWEQLPDIPGPARHHPYYFEIDGDVYVGLGHGSDFLQGAVLANTNIYRSWYKWDEESFDWIEMESFPGEGRVAGTQFSYNGKGYVLSGQGEDHRNFEEGEFWEYDPQSDSWSAMPPHPGPESRWAPGSFLIDNVVYFLAGQYQETQSADLKDMWKFELPKLIGSVEENKTYGLYPNPANNFISIKDLVPNSDVQIYNTYGELLINSDSKNINISKLSSGAYIAKYMNNGELIQENFIKK